MNKQHARERLERRKASEGLWPEQQSATNTTEVPASVHEALATEGQSLDSETRAFMEPRFGHDFSQVRIHTGERAAESAREVNALAYTVGSDVVFEQGKYAPETLEGKRLLAHELTHVVQQGFQSTLPGNVDGLTISANPFLETEAHNMEQFSNTTFWQHNLNRLIAPTLQKFDSFEHIELGDAKGSPATGLILLESHKKDLPEHRQPVETWHSPWRELVSRKETTDDQKRALIEGLTYGEIVALSGDFYENFETLNRASLREIFDLIPLIRGKSTTTIQLQQATGGRYLELAERNISHFSNVRVGVRNIDVWRKMHTEAINAAIMGDQNRAWAMNAAADHFLTDAFSAGHLRTARDVLLKQGLGGQIQSKILHDLDNEHGVEVTNRRNDHWIAYGDDHLDDHQKDAVRNREIAIEAVASSKKDIMKALHSRPLEFKEFVNEHGEFEAEQLIPTPVDPKHDRWIGRPNDYTTMREVDYTQVFDIREDDYTQFDIREDDYTQATDKLIKEEGKGLAQDYWHHDDQIVDWVNKQSQAAIERQPNSEKIRMVKSLLKGYVSKADKQAIKRIMETVFTPEDILQFHHELGFDPHMWRN